MKPVAEPVELRSSTMVAQISPQGGTVQGLWWGVSKGLSLLRNNASEANAAPTETAAFLLVPFGNRLGGNAFTCNGKRFDLRSNSELDPLYLHGDGWLGRWTVTQQSPDSVSLLYRHRGDNGPYRYRAEQHFSIAADRLTLRMAVTNDGEEALPFGLGWHPYFPLDADTTLQFQAQTMRPEGPGSWPGAARPLDGDFDFRRQRILPAARLNNGFSGWDGRATIRWPRQNASLAIEADRVFSHVFVYSPHGEPGADFFCFEPMSHMADDHNRDHFGDLKLLTPGATLEGSIRLLPSVGSTG